MDASLGSLDLFLLYAWVVFSILFMAFGLGRYPLRWGFGVSWLLDLRSARLRQVEWRHQRTTKTFLLSASKRPCYNVCHASCGNALKARLRRKEGTEAIKPLRGLGHEFSKNVLVDTHTLMKWRDVLSSIATVSKIKCNVLKSDTERHSAADC